MICNIKLIMNKHLECIMCVRVYYYKICYLGQRLDRKMRIIYEIVCLVYVLIYVLFEDHRNIIAPH